MHQTQRSKRFRRARGSALITVTLIGLFVMLLAAALVNQFSVAEAEAVAHSLAKTRIYWASMGHINYGLSRVSREGLCGGTCVDDSSRVASLNDILTELNTGGGARRWDFGNNYTFTLSASVADDPVPDDGKVRATVSLQPVTGTPFDVLNGIEGRIPPNLVVNICLSPPCDSPNTSTSGENKIEELRRR